MKNLLLAIGIVSIFLVGTADAVARRGGATSARSYFQQQNSSVRSQWQRSFSPLSYRFSRNFSRSDYARWRGLETLPGTSADGEDPATETQFCNLSGSIIGEYLTTTEIENRCCECDDGWECEYDSVAGNVPHACSSENEE
ncbi:hypothetical protein HN954_00025 [bacterium]|nr:hypothetical protein [bacterium]MBT6832023.1 hypothetical protein [bacterium]MBT6995804.1 hypothetical protein [bacterium]MBT7772385.1 hypothetical protein [bacterium]